MNVNRFAAGSVCLCFALGLWAFTCPEVAAAEKTSQRKKPKAQAEAEAAPAKSIESLAEAARASVVVISHFGRDGKENGVGAGFVVASNGLIATSLHVIGEARPIAVQLSGGQRHRVTEIHAWDRKLDLAVIRIDADKLSVLPLGDSDTLKQGAPILAMGNPLGLQHSVVQGVVSAKRDFDGIEMIQLAIPIEPGNSGGPLLDLQGRVHGLLTLKSALTANLGFAMPVNALKPLLQKPNPVPMERWLTIGALNPRDWTPLMGARWSQKAGRIQVEGLGDGFGGRSLCLSQEKVPERPYELAVTVRLDDESGAAGLAFASDGADRCYGFYPSGGQLRLTRFDGPNVFSWTILRQVASPHYRPGDWNTLKVRVEKEKLSCYVNGQLVIESTDQILTSGQVGLAKFRDTRAAFKGFLLGNNLASPQSSPPAELVASITKQIQEGSDSPDLVQKLQPHAHAVETILGDRARKLESEAAQLRKLAIAVHRQSVQSELVALFRAPDEKVDLFYAALLVAKFDNAELDVQPYRRQMEEMGRELGAKLPAQADAAARLAALTHFLFTDNGFHGSRADYYNRANSYMNDVLDDREGLPITLSVLFLELARRIGLENMAGVSLPGHFVVKYAPRNGAEQLIDVHDGGKVLTRAQAEQVVFDHTGGALREEHLKAASKRDIIIRMLRNLSGIAQSSESPADSLRYADLIVALSPDAPLERLERARLRLQSGDVGGAREDFRWLIEHAPSGIDLERVEEVYRSLQENPSRKVD